MELKSSKAVGLSLTSGHWGDGEVQHKEQQLEVGVDNQRSPCRFADHIAGPETPRGGVTPGRKIAVEGKLYFLRDLHIPVVLSCLM